MFAYIPARGGSKRIPHKNIKSLGGKPVIGHVIETLNSLDFIDQVYVSTDDAEIAEVAEDFGGTCLDLRAENLSNDQAGFMELIRDDLPRFIAHHGSDDVLFVLATAALVPKRVYEAAYDLWLEKKPDVLMSCEKAFPWWDMVQKPDGFWTPIFPDRLLINSQDQEPSLVDAGLFYFFHQKIAANFVSIKQADRLLPWIVPQAYTGDIDTPEDWYALEKKYAEQNKAE